MKTRELDAMDRLLEKRMAEKRLPKSTSDIGLREVPKKKDAEQAAIDHLRGESRRAALLAEAQSFLGTRDAVATPEQDLIARDQLARLERAMAEMPPLSRRIFYLSRFEEKSQREIAEIVGLSPTAVFKHIRKVLDHLAGVRDA